MVHQTELINILTMILNIIPSDLFIMPLERGRCQPNHHPPQLVNHLKKRPPNVNENGMLFNQWFYGTEGGFAGVSRERDNTKVKPRICLLRLTSFIILLCLPHVQIL